VSNADLVVISSVRRNPMLEAEWAGAIDWLKRMRVQEAHLASVCTGAFLLAATGLLDGREATTHWGAVDLFRALYPRVRLMPRRIVTESGNLFCSGGTQAAIDLSLYLVRRYAGAVVAEECARALVHDLWRDSQAPYVAFNFQRNHGDSAILAAQAIIEAEHGADIGVDDLAARVGLSFRTFERRFKAATGDKPLAYIQRVRVEAAKEHLARGNETFEEITAAVGYEDASSFRRLFTRLTGISPGQYRMRFRQDPVS